MINGNLSKSSAVCLLRLSLLRLCQLALHQLKHALLDSVGVHSITRQQHLNQKPFVVRRWYGRRPVFLRRRLLLIEPALRLATIRFELARQGFADLTVAALKLAPVLRRDSQLLGKTCFESLQLVTGRTDHGGALELIEECGCVGETDVGKVGHPPMINGHVAQA